MERDQGVINGLVEPDYSVHPYLDPFLPTRNAAAFRALFRQFLRIRADDDLYNSFLNKMLRPDREDGSMRENLRRAASYLSQVEFYIDGLLDLLPEERALPLRSLDRARRCEDVRDLLAGIFQGGDTRIRFEAQRKLYLAKLFFDIEHTWKVQRGLVHQQYVEALMEQSLFSHLVGESDIDICFNIQADGISMDYTEGRVAEDQECWGFHKRDLAVPYHLGTHRLTVYYYSCRFKREVIPFLYLRGEVNYRLRPVEIWMGLKDRRSGSIVSKMIRKGESHPGRIEDILGAMFIVTDLLEVERLKDILMDNFAGPLRFRNVTDTLTRESDRSRLNADSGAGYNVYKAEVDLLYPGEPDETHPPYLFTVELQIYTLESYLRTIHTEHYASHQRFKKRQFLRGILPLLFPAAVYGEETIRACLEDSGLGGGKGRMGGERAVRRAD